jgi:hypothetical protein
MDLDAAKNVDLVLNHAGYEPVRIKVDLALGRTADINQTLKELPKLGSIQLKITGAGWADVYYKGKNLGRTPTMKGLTTFRLPIGKQQLVVENPAVKKKQTVTVDVTGGAQAPIDVRL